MADDNKPAPSGLLQGAQAWVALAGAIITAWGGWITIQINQINSRVQQNTAERNWTAIVFDKYSDAITRDKLSTEQRIAALNGLVNLTDLIEREKLRLKMAQVIRDQLDAYSQQLQQLSTTQTGAEKAQTVALAAQAGAIADAANLKVNQLVQSAAVTGTGGEVAAQPAPKASWANYDFDIFYCQGSPELEASALQSANAIAALKGLDPAASGRWRVRPLSVERNASPGFGITGILIRPSAKDEVTLAKQMQAIIKQQRTLDTASDSVRIQTISFPTPYYVSVFVCPQPRPAAPTTPVTQ